MEICLEATAAHQVVEFVPAFENFHALAATGAVVMTHQALHVMVVLSE